VCLPFYYLLVDHQVSEINELNKTKRLLNEIRAIHKSAQSVIQTKEYTVKAHGGELKVETKEGEGSTFIIRLPVN
jgi:light-regulated signal transduction histidine kinase (bacteriophytochrome)